MKLLVQEYLKAGNSLKDLEDNYGVISKEMNGKLCLNYDIIKAKPSDKLSQQCRGLVLRKDSFEVVACPFFRFFNKEQGIAAEIDWNTAVYEEKRDGSLIIGYFDHVQNKWCVGTRAHSEAHIEIYVNEIFGNLSFAQLVDTTITLMWGKINSKNIRDIQSLMNSCPKDNTYIFELTSPVNKIVCRYDDYKLTLLGVRNNISLKEFHTKEFIHHFNDFGLKTSREFEFKNVNHMRQEVFDWSPLDYEGVVVRDENFNRIKVKSPAYCAYNSMHDRLSSWKGCVETILLGKDDDILPFMTSQVVEKIVFLKPIINQALTQIQNEYDSIKGIGDQKEFALKAQKSLWPGALFALRRDSESELLTFAIGSKSKDQKAFSSSSKTLLKICMKMSPSLAKKVEESKTV